MTRRLLRAIATAALLASGAATAQHGASGLPPAPRGDAGADAPLVAAGNVYSALHGRLALCKAIAPETAAQVEKDAQKFRRDYPTLLKLAQQSRFWDKARESSEKFNKRTIEMTLPDKHKAIGDSMCRDSTDYLFAGKPEKDSPAAQRLIGILRRSAKAAS